jgi:hypothetical protein
MTMTFAHVPTKYAEQYFARLAILWRRRWPSIAVENGHAVIALEIGTAEFTAARDFLDITITASSGADAALLEDAVSDYLDALADQEELHYQWIAPPPKQFGDATPRFFFSRRFPSENR